MADKPKITLKLDQQVAVGFTLPDGTRVPTQPAKVARVEGKAVELELEGGWRVTVLT